MLKRKKSRTYVGPCWFRLTCRVRRRQGRLLAQLVKSLTDDFCSEERAVEVEQFFREHPHPGAERSIQQSLETIRLNAAWLQRDRLYSDEDEPA